MGSEGPPAGGDRLISSHSLEELELDPESAGLDPLAALEDEPLATEQLEELELEEGLDLPPLAPLGEEVMATDQVELPPEADEGWDERTELLDAAPEALRSEARAPEARAPEARAPEALAPEVEATEYVGTRPLAPHPGLERLYGFDEDDEVGHTEVIDRDDLLAPDRPQRAADRPSTPPTAAPGVDAPGVDAPGVDAPGVDAPGVDAPGAAAPGAAALVRVAPWRSLHPASLLVNLIPRAWRTLSGLWIVALALVVGGRTQGLSPGMGAWIALILAGGTGSTLIHYLTLRYRVQNGRLEIRQGLFSRQARVIDPARIQNVSLVRNPFHKLSGLVEVRLETAGDVRTEGLLSALSVSDAQALMRALDEARGQAPKADEEAAPPERHLLGMGPGEIVAYGLSQGSAGKVAVLFAVGMEVLSVLSPEDSQRALVQMSPARMAALVMLAFAASWLGETVLAVVRHHGFTLARVTATGRGGVPEHRLRASEGLLTRREVQIPIHKVQIVMADEPLLRRSMGYGTLSVETAGLGSATEGITRAELVVPMAERADMAALMLEAIPGLGFDPWERPLQPAHPRALWRAAVGAFLRGSALAAVLMAAAWPWGLLGMFLPVISVFTAWLDWRTQGWLVTPEVVVARRGFWRRRTWVLSRAKLQGVHLFQGPMMRWHGLGRLALRVAGSQVVLPDIGYARAEALLDELGPR